MRAATLLLHPARNLGVARLESAVAEVLNARVVQVEQRSNAPRSRLDLAHELLGCGDVVLHQHVDAIGTEARNLSEWRERLLPPHGCP